MSIRVGRIVSDENVELLLESQLLNEGRYVVWHRHCILYIFFWLPNFAHRLLWEAVVCCWTFLHTWQILAGPVSAANFSLINNTENDKNMLSILCKGICYFTYIWGRIFDSSYGSVIENLDLIVIGPNFRFFRQVLPLMEFKLFAVLSDPAHWIDGNLSPHCILSYPLYLTYWMTTIR